MNKQLKTKYDEAIRETVVTSRGIEWCDFTWNYIGGCKHRCRWRMPDGSIAICYAESTANVMQSGYPNGFEHHYVRPHMLDEPLRHKMPAKIFLDSMSDLMGNWVGDDEIQRVLDICRQAHWHVFQLLTKNAPRLVKFDLPRNVWVGVSAPPTFMFGKELTPEQQRSMVNKQLDMLWVLKQRGHPVTWMSIEPLSFDIGAIFEEWLRDDQTRGTPMGRLPIDWAVIGAASNGPKHFQPEPTHVEECHRVLRAHDVKIFHKGNLEWTPHLEEWPAAFQTLKQEVML
jgi:protein gp37